MGNLIKKLATYMGDKIGRGLCVIKMHHWSHPGGDCIVCGKHDDFFERQREEDYKNMMKGTDNEWDS